jgi:hypothetical protein
MSRRTSRFVLCSLWTLSSATACTFMEDAWEPPPEGARPASCLEARATTGDVDGEYMLYLDNVPARSWLAYCHDMAGAPAEYLTLRAAYPGANTSRLEAFDGDRFGAVNTTYERLRIDPRTRRVDISDHTFARTAGRARIDGQGDVTVVPVAVAAACSNDLRIATRGHSNLDLSGTEFVIDSTFCLHGADESLSDVWSARGGARVDLEVVPAAAGTCATAAPQPCLSSPLGDAAGFHLQLAFQP